MPDDQTTRPAPDVDAVVIGAGFSGLYMVHRLRDERGMTVQGFDAADTVGGTWYWNRYPGARTDSMYSIYQFSFSKELRDEWTFSELYPPQPEMSAYLNWVADRLDLRRSFRFRTRVESATYDEQTGLWTVSADDGTSVTCRFLVSGLGLLTAPNVPPFANLDSFSGEWYHSAAWPADVDLAGKRVALVGTGSTGIQMLPHLAEQAGEVVVLQRTPNYVVPARNRPLTEQEQRESREQHEEIRERIRSHFFCMPFGSVGPSALAVDEATRRQVYEHAWELGGFHVVFGTFDDILTSVEANETLCEFIRERIKMIVQDPATAEILTPRGYPYGAKRPPAGTDYYETFNRDNVSVVDVSSDPIEEITPRGIRVAGREIEADVIVFATGFDATTGAYDNIDIRGRDGQTLKDKWREGPVSNMGLSVAGFPNFFIVSGPLSPFANIPTCVEENVDWVVDAVDWLGKNGLGSLEATDEAERAWTRHVQEAADFTVAGAGRDSHSWFTGANVEGKAVSVNLYFGGADNYFAQCRAAAENDYAGFTAR